MNELPALGDNPISKEIHKGVYQIEPFVFQLCRFKKYESFRFQAHRLFGNRYPRI